MKHSLGASKVFVFLSFADGSSGRMFLELVARFLFSSQVGPLVYTIGIQTVLYQNSCNSPSRSYQTRPVLLTSSPVGKCLLTSNRNCLLDCTPVVHVSAGNLVSGVCVFMVHLNLVTRFHQLSLTCHPLRFLVQVWQLVSERSRRN